VGDPGKSPGGILLLRTNTNLLIRLNIRNHRILPQQLDRTLGKLSRIPLELVRDVVRVLDHPEQIRERVVEAKGMLSARGSRGSEERGGEEGVVLCDGGIVGVGVEDDDVVVFNRLCVGGRVEGGLVAGRAVQVVGDEERGDVGHKRRECHERHNVDHDGRAHAKQGRVECARKNGVRMGWVGLGWSRWEARMSKVWGACGLLMRPGWGK
jgi:hypothetical protein